MSKRWFRTHQWLRRGLSALTAKPVLLFPILGAVRGYDVRKLAIDSRVGLWIALLAIPEGLAFALIAGLPPEHGIHAAIAGLALGAMFSGARFVSFGPAVTTAVMLLSMFVQLGIDPEARASAVALLLVLSGLLLIVGAWFKVAQLTRYISRSVTIGWITAAAALLIVSQLKHVLGLALPESGVFLENLTAVGHAIRFTEWPPLLVGALTAGAYLILNHRFHAAPAAAIAALAGTGAAILLREAQFPVEGLSISATTDGLLPDGGALDLRWSGVIANAALALALLSLLEVSMIGRSYAARSGDRFDGDQHMYGLGFASLGNALLGGMPPSVSLSRSRIAWRGRAATAVSGVFAALICGVLFFAVAPFLAHIPRSALAALAIVLATEAVSRHFLRVIVRSTRDDATVLFATIAAGLLFRLDVALYVGAGVSIVFFLRRVGVPELQEYGFTQEGQLTAVNTQGERPLPDISIVHVEGDLFFGAAEIFLEQMRRVCEDPNLRVVVLRVRNARHLDATCALAIEEFLRFARGRGRHVIVAGAHREIFRVFRRSGLLALLGRENFFMNVPSNPTVSTRNALKRAQTLLGTRQANIRIYVDPTKNSSQPGAAA